MAFLMQRRSLIALLVAFALVVCSVAATAYLYLKQSHDRELVRHSINVQILISRALSVLQDAETGQRGYLLTGLDGYLAPYETAKANLAQTIKDLGEAVADNPQQTQQVAALKAAAQDKIDELEQTVALKKQNRDDEARAIVMSGVGKERMDKARNIVETLRANEREVLTGREAVVRSANSATQIAIGSVLLLSILLTAIAISDIRRQYAAIAQSNAELRDSNRKIMDEVTRRERIEAQLRQAQKMEAVGQLTGGIAHDFNNMLAVVIAGLNLLKRRLDRGETNVTQFIDGALDGAQRAATLTQRLLAFSRQQPLAPQSIEVNKLVAGMAEMIRRTLGEPIHIETVLAGGLWRTHADPGQLENSILNLAVNARDAMPEGGKLTIETANAELDENYSAQHLDVSAGQYVLITLTDTGTGMSSEIVARAFDPFFTTKEPGKGTGLGLSQVLGFVKQTGGHIKIYSEPALGTAVKIYLPRYRGEATEAPVAPAGEKMPASTPGETVLVVEDEERMLAFSVEAFRELGYVVLSANDATSALRVISSHPEITLLFTDVVMPDMNGRKLAEQALRKLPRLKVIYTTGFSRNAVIHNGVLDDDVNFLAKPFTIDQLAAKVRRVLDDGK